MMGAILSEEILKQYQDLCQKADLFLEQHQANEAIEEYQKALAVLPEGISIIPELWWDIMRLRW